MTRRPPAIRRHPGPGRRARRAAFAQTPEEKKIVVTMQALGKKTAWPAMTWLPIRARLANKGALPGRVTLGVSAQSRGRTFSFDDMTVRTVIDIEPGTVKEMFLYFPPQECLVPRNYRGFSILGTFGVEGRFDTPFLITDLSVPGAEDKESFLVVGDTRDAQQLASLLSDLAEPPPVTFTTYKRVLIKPGNGPAKGDGQTKEDGGDGQGENRDDIGMAEGAPPAPAGQAYRVVPVVTTNPMPAEWRVQQIPLEALPDRPEGLDAFTVIILEGGDTSGIPLAGRRALIDWCVAGGVLVFSPGETFEVFQDDMLAATHPYRVRESLPSREITDFGPTRKDGQPHVQTVHALGGGYPLQMTREGLPLVATHPLGLGCTVAYATSLTALEPVDPKIARGLLKRHLALEGERSHYRGRMYSYEFSSNANRNQAGKGKAAAPFDAVRKNPNVPLNTAMRDFRYLEHVTYDQDDMDDLSREFVAGLAESVVGAPGIGFVSFILVVFVVVTGPLNFTLLRRKSLSALTAVTVPALSVLFVVLIVISGFAIKGGARASRLRVIETRSGRSRGVVTDLILFRGSAKGHYTFDLGPGRMPRPEVTPSFNFQMDPSEPADLKLHIERWVTRGIRSECAVDLGGSVVVADVGGKGVRVINNLPWPLERLTVTGSITSIKAPAVEETTILVHNAHVEASAEAFLPYGGSPQVVLTPEDYFLIAPAVHLEGSRFPYALVATAFIDFKGPALSANRTAVPFSLDKTMILLPVMMEGR